ncbi:hypothetical protein FRC03_001420 [Tulasnella sp. 419]|nr:hypothetical protein FRC02_000735 [Tulasnella sp. 418]KAG8964741.1 hypothetical protein FRC03_001420 [Tulasnella sp. 419]
MSAAEVDEFHKLAKHLAEVKQRYFELSQNERASTVFTAVSNTQITGAAPTKRAAELAVARQAVEQANGAVRAYRVLHPGIKYEPLPTTGYASN